MRLQPVSSITSDKSNVRERAPRFLGIAFVAVCFSAGCAGKPPPDPETPPPAPVGLATTQAIAIGEWTDFSGATQPLPNHVARITAAVEGRVVWLLSDPDAKNGQALAEGQRVEKGQIVGRLYDRLVQANRDKLKNALEETKEQKQQAAYAVELAKIELKRVSELFANAMNGTDVRLANRIQLENAQLALKTAESKQKEVVAKEKGMEGDLAGITEQLDQYVLRAPITGRLGPIQVVPGSTLAIGANVAEVMDLDDIDVLCFVPPYTAARLAMGQTARVVEDKEGAVGPEGKIVFIAVQAQPDTGCFAVKVRFPNPDLRLRGGSWVRVEVLTKPEQLRVTIPESALLEDQDPPSVVIVPDLKTKFNEETKKDEDLGTARKLRAIIGIRDRRWHVVEILRLEDPKKKEEVPLDDQTQFVIKGGNGLEDGDRVKKEAEED
jgi:RND family efflux transporter MFP subunit